MACDIEAPEVALGRVEEMSDHVPELPTGARRRHVPARGIRRELEHLVDLAPEHTEESTAARRVLEIPALVVDHLLLPCGAAQVNP